MLITEPGVSQTGVFVALLEGGAALAAQRSWRGVRTLAALTRRHWILAGLLVAGARLWVITQIAYRPAVFYIDSYKYLTGLAVYDPEGFRFLLAHPLGGNLAVVSAFQHLLGLAMGLASVPCWSGGRAAVGGALAAAPILLDAYQLRGVHPGRLAGHAKRSRRRLRLGRVEFSWCCQLPALVTLPLAGVLGGTLITTRTRPGKLAEELRARSQFSRANIA